MSYCRNGVRDDSTKLIVEITQAIPASTDVATIMKYCGNPKSNDIKKSISNYGGSLYFYRCPLKANFNLNTKLPWRSSHPANDFATLVAKPWKFFPPNNSTNSPLSCCSTRRE